MTNHNPDRKSAVALGYQAQSQNAPNVKAKGKGYVAEEIVKRAKQNNVPVQEDPSLVELLSQLEIDQNIPPDLYEVVAEVFAFLYRVDQHSQ
ncbi:EscU/YscU/HrcU family type III secretion system export apparatus switch protein [Salibacterium salarium]|uniref:EscU/YscU/HrcU family type III secretion system export apparatus switch protein n=1 Tax=Salibacterium salarium TaxID=284579 RepID=A0A3R9QQM6_9BACI|nr:EscU/YscU/HrcU family type III secretion system export apparatus switch protein [Salibacterium salarium]RSL31249.1 EscU/YscU/HrcU family type III secretion system export apparatus switch protein [Salibacterium salarium]